MSAEPRQPGWYIAQRIATELDPVVVRVSTDLKGGCTTVWEIGRRDPSTLADWKLLQKVHPSGTTTDLDLDRFQKAAWEDGRRTGEADERRRQLEYEAARDRECPTFSAPLSGTDTDFREVGEVILQVRMTAEAAESLSAGLSDLLCWAQGFNAALGDDTSRMPMGIESVRRVRETITKAQRAAEKAKSA